MQRFQVNARLGRNRTGSENPGCSVQKLGLPIRDLALVNLKRARLFGKRLLAFDSGQRHLRLESRTVIPAGFLRHRCS